MSNQKIVLQQFQDTHYEIKLVAEQSGSVLKVNEFNNSAVSRGFIEIESGGYLVFNAFMNQVTLDKLIHVSVAKENEGHMMIWTAYVTIVDSMADGTIYLTAGPEEVYSPDGVVSGTVAIIEGGLN